MEESSSDAGMTLSCVGEERGFVGGTVVGEECGFVGG